MMSCRSLPYYYEDDDDVSTIMHHEQGFEVAPNTPLRGRMMLTPSPSRRQRVIPYSPKRSQSFTYRERSPKRKNRLLTPIRALSFRRKKKNQLPPGPDSEAAMVLRVSLIALELE